LKHHTQLTKFKYWWTSTAIRRWARTTLVVSDRRILFPRHKTRHWPCHPLHNLTPITAITSPTTLLYVSEIPDNMHANHNRNITAELILFNIVNCSDTLTLASNRLHFCDTRRPGRQLQMWIKTV